MPLFGNPVLPVPTRFCSARTLSNMLRPTTRRREQDCLHDISPRVLAACPMSSTVPSLQRRSRLLDPYLQVCWYCPRPTHVLDPPIRHDYPAR
jgi:hypothetical protein